jgi:hypothetical protein
MEALFAEHVNYANAMATTTLTIFVLYIFMVMMRLVSYSEQELAHSRHSMDKGVAALRCRTPAAGMLSSACEGCGSGQERNRGL